jgi:hypothetical protein
MHLDEEQLQRLLHGESASATERSMREHLSTCTDCRTRLSDAQRDETEIHALLRLVDHPPPVVGAEAVAASARAHDGGWGRWAAGLLLALTAAGAAYAAPGSPLRGWTRAALELVRDDREPEPPQAPATAPEMAGLAIAPGDTLTILFKSAQPQARARVSLGEGAEVRVRAPSGAATFGSDAERLVIDNRDSIATFEIEIPRDAPRVEIRVAGTRIFLKDGSRVMAQGAGDGREPYLLPLSPPSQ